MARGGSDDIGTLLREVVPANSPTVLALQDTTLTDAR